jgi:hypothetical protein
MNQQKFDFQSFNKYKMMKQRLTRLRFANDFTKFFFLGLFWTPSILEAQTCPGNIFINGSMETTNGKAFNTTYQGSTASTGSSLGSSNAFPDVGWSDANSGGYYVTGANAQDGTKFFYFPSVDKCLNGNAAIASACKAYKVTFYAAAFTASGAQQASDFTFHYKFYTGATYNLANVIGDEDDYKFTAPASTGWSNLNWQKYTAIVVSPPTSEGLRLKFTAASSSSGVAFDNICVTEALPSDFIVSSNPACGGSLQLMASSLMDYQPSTSPALVKFNWSGPNGFTSTAQKPVVGTMTAALAGTYSVTITSGPSGNTCQQVGSLTIANPCVAACTAPTIANVSATQATCTGATANSDASVHLTGIVGMAKYAYGTNGTAGLFALNATASTASSINITGIANPVSAATYTFRAWGVDTTCFNDTTLVLNPAVCLVCSITGTFTQNGCNNNGTTATTTDDYFRVTVSGVTATNGGASGKYEVVLNGTVLNTSGTAYGTPVTVGTTTTFKSDGATTYSLTIRDLDQPACVTPTFTTIASASCSVIPCPSQLCIPVTVTRPH